MRIYSITNFWMMYTQLMNKGITILATAVLVTTLMMLTSPTVYAASPDLTIVDFGEVGDEVPFITVEGTAGGMVPEEEGEIYVYGISNEDGIFAAISDGGEWQAVELELNRGFCITSQTEVGDVLLDGDTVTIEGLAAEQTETAFTAVFSTEKKDVSGEEDVEDATCLVKVFSGTLPEID